MREMTAANANSTLARRRLVICLFFCYFGFCKWFRMDSVNSRSVFPMRNLTAASLNSTLARRNQQVQRGEATLKRVLNTGPTPSTSACPTNVPANVSRCVRAHVRHSTASARARRPRNAPWTNTARPSTHFSTNSVTLPRHARTFREQHMYSRALNAVFTEFP